MGWIWDKYNSGMNMDYTSWFPELEKEYGDWQISEKNWKDLANGIKWGLILQGFNYQNENNIG